MNAEKIINAEGASAGRVASDAAKSSLKGEQVVVVNCAKSIITGGKKQAIKKYLDIKQKGGSGQRGPYISSSPEKILKRIIRGMLPHRKSRGKDALKRIKCYNQVPEKYKDKFEKAEKINLGISLKELSKRLKEE